VRPSGRPAVRHVNSEFLPEFTDRFRKVRPGDPHQKRKNVAARAASETMKNLAGRTDRKGRRFFLMERAETFQVLAGTGQTHVMPYHLDDIDSIPDLVDHIFRNQTSAHGSRGSYFPTEYRQER
jgi:hypothetical protein